MAGYSGTRNRKGWFNSYGPAYTPLRHFSTLQSPGFDTFGMLIHGREETISE